MAVSPTPEPTLRRDMTVLLGCAGVGLCVCAALVAAIYWYARQRWRPPPDAIAIMENDAGLHYLHEQNYVDGLPYYEDLVNRYPDNALIHSNYAIALAYAGKRRQAFAAFERSIQLEPGFYAAHSGLGTLHVQEDHPRVGEAAFRRALALNPDHAAAHTGLATALGRQGRVADAEAALDAAWALTFDAADRQVRLGWLYATNCDRDRALTAFEEGLRVAPQDYWLQVAFAYWLGKWGMPEEGRRLLAATEALDPGRGQTPVTRAYILADVGRYSEARAQLEVARERGYAFPRDAEDDVLLQQLGLGGADTAAPAGLVAAHPPERGEQQY